MNAMNETEVRAQHDHLDSLAKATPLSALTELIWNALDADATKVDVTIKENDIDGIEEILVEDNGVGLPFDEAELAFGNLGGSWKKQASRTKRDKRLLHGKNGKGRFKAFALGSDVAWDVCYADNGALLQYSVRGKRSQLKAFPVDQPSKADHEHTGTTVCISGITESLGMFAEDGNALDRLGEEFALYLRDYPAVRIYFRGDEVNPSHLQKDFKEYVLSDIEVGKGRKVSAVLQIIEWSVKRERKICLCDEGGFKLHEVEAALRPGSEFQFTAYLRSKFISELRDQDRLELEELDTGLKTLVDSARDKIRGHFREKKSHAAADLLQEWKDEGIYPFQGETVDPVETARRQVSDICALNVHEFLDDFRKAETKSRKFTLRILREALEDNPVALQRIFNEILDLPKDKQAEFADLLDRTSLAAIIESSKLVTDRLAFLKGLEELLFNKESKKELEERSQLHKILNEETWICGEEYHLTASDETLTTVLRKQILKLRPKEKLDEVVRDDGKKAVIDLLLAREVPQNHKNRREFLVVELKRPSQKVDLEVKAQIES